MNRSSESESQHSPSSLAEESIEADSEGVAAQGDQEKKTKRGEKKKRTVHWTKR